MGGVVGTVGLALGGGYEVSDWSDVLGEGTSCWKGGLVLSGGFPSCVAGSRWPVSSGELLG